MSAPPHNASIESLRARRRLRARRAATLAVAVAAVCAAVVAAALLSASTLASNDSDRRDHRLESEVRSAAAAFAILVARADGRAGSAASEPSFQRALLGGDRGAVRRIAAERDLAVYRMGALWAGRESRPAVTRSIAVVGRSGRILGRVVAAVPLDAALVRRLRREAGIARADSLALLRGAAAAAAPKNRVVALRRRGRDLRSFAVPLVDQPAVALRGTTAASILGDTALHRAAWIALAVLASLATAALAAYGLLIARRTRGSPFPMRSRRDVRQVLGLLGDALASTHDPEKLLPVILHATMEATGAAGGVVVSNGVEVAREGEPTTGSGDALRLDLTPDEAADARVSLLLYPGAGRFDETTTALARSLAAQAAVALENVRLHGIVQRQAVTDELTGLANRRSFQETIESELRRAERFGTALSLIVADLDDFKLVNDQHGHHGGDQVLRAFGTVLRRRIREVDEAARIGGEEFAIVLPATDTAGAEALAGSLRAAVEELVVPIASGDSVKITASFGVASFPPASSADDLLTAADLALYAAKREGKNRVLTHSPDPGWRPPAE